MTCRYDVSFEMKLSVSKYPSGSDQSSMCCLKSAREMLEDGVGLGFRGSWEVSAIRIKPRIDTRRKTNAVFRMGTTIIRDLRFRNSDFRTTICRDFKIMRAIPSAAVEIRPAGMQDIDKMCEFVEELLVKWDARATKRDAQRVYEHVMKSPDLGVILVAETLAENTGTTEGRKGGMCGFAYASYEWRSELSLI